MGKSIQVSARLPAAMLAQIEEYLAAEMRQGREMTVAAFIRMAIRRALVEEQPKRGPEN